MLWPILVCIVGYSDSSYNRRIPVRVMALSLAVLVCPTVEVIMCRYSCSQRVKPNDSSD